MYLLDTGTGMWFMAMIHQSESRRARASEGWAGEAEAWACQWAWACERAYDLV